MILQSRLHLQLSLLVTNRIDELLVFLHQTDNVIACSNVDVRCLGLRAEDLDDLDIGFGVTFKEFAELGVGAFDGLFDRGV